MTLIDADKQGFERDNPSPNGHDVVLPGAHKAVATTSLNYATDASSSNAQAAGFGTLRVVWQTTDTITVVNGAGPTVKTYTHNIGVLPLVFGAGTQSYTHSGTPFTNYLVMFNNNLNTGLSLAMFNNDLNSFTVAFDDIGGGDAAYSNTVYVVTFKVSIFQ